MFTKFGEAIHKGVARTEESHHAGGIFAVQSLKIESANLIKLLCESFRNVYFRHSIFAGRGNGVFSEFYARAHRLSHMQCRIDTDAVEATQLLHKHSAHGGADNQIRLFRLTKGLEKRQLLGGHQRDVRVEHFSVRQFLLQQCGSMCSTARAEAVNIQDFLSCEIIESLFEIHLPSFSSEVREKKREEQVLCSSLALGEALHSGSSRPFFYEIERTKPVHERAE